MTSTNLRYSIYDGVFANIFATLTGGAFLTGFALNLGFNELLIGLLGAMPFIVTIFQLPAAYIIDRKGGHKKISFWFSLFARLIWVPILIVAIWPNFSLNLKVAIILGLMGWFRIPLDFGTALFGALLIGLGIDGSIHFLHYSHNLSLMGIRGEAALRETMAHVGRAIVVANATTCCGFLVLIFSSMTALRNFAIVNSVAILLVTISLLSVLPALATLLQKDRS